MPILICRVVTGSNYLKSYFQPFNDQASFPLTKIIFFKHFILFCFKICQQYDCQDLVFNFYTQIKNILNEILTKKLFFRCTTIS